MENNPSFYITATSGNFGALGIFHVHAPEEVLVRTLDCRIGARKGGGSSIPLAVNELRYGWLQDNAGVVVDEVMLAAFHPGMRVLMSHGGFVIRERIECFLSENGYEALVLDGGKEDRVAGIPDMRMAVLLSSCITEAQAAAVLEMAEGSEPGKEYGGLLMTHRLLLAGPPNAGKSSLLNNLAGHDRAFVHAEAGATTDVVDELVDIGGYAVLVGDMPGFAADSDSLGRDAWRKAVGRLSVADAVLFVCDGSREWDEGTGNAAAAVAAALRAARTPVLVVQNKADQPLAMRGEPWRPYFPDAAVIRVCSLPDGDAACRLGEKAIQLFDGV